MTDSKEILLGWEYWHVRNGEHKILEVPGALRITRSAWTRRGSTWSNFSTKPMLPSNSPRASSLVAQRSHVCTVIMIETSTSPVSAHCSILCKLALVPGYTSLARLALASPILAEPSSLTVPTSPAPTLTLVTA